MAMGCLLLETRGFPTGMVVLLTDCFTNKSINPGLGFVSQARIIPFIPAKAMEFKPLTLFTSIANGYRGAWISSPG
jgi:hypothetical protein